MRDVHNKALISDPIRLSEAAQAVWASLERKGYAEKTEYLNPSNELI